MSIYELPSGKWRSQVYDPATGKNVGVGHILGGASVFPNRKQAIRAREQARFRLEEIDPRNVTVASFAKRWTTEPLFTAARPKESTRIYNEQQIRRFVETYGDRRLRAINDEIVSQWLADGKGKIGQAKVLAAMFNDAASAKAGRLIPVNPFAGLSLSKGHGNRFRKPPTEQKAWEIIEAAYQLVGDGYGAWMQVACFTGLRPGELDALRWENVDFASDTIHVREQFNSGSHNFTSPKNGLEREAPLTDHARAALLKLPRQSKFCFVPLRADHYTRNSRAYHWNAVRAKADWNGSLYLATRHFAGWYMRNVLGLDSEDVAVALGHTDGGELVRRLYGHLEHRKALDRVRQAYADRANVVPMHDRKRESA